MTALSPPVKRELTNSDNAVSSEEARTVSTNGANTKEPDGAEPQRKGVGDGAGPGAGTEAEPAG